MLRVYLRPDKWYNEKVMRNSINPLVFYLFFFLVIVGLIFSDYQQHRQVEVQAEKEVQVEKTETTIETSEGEENKVIEDRLAMMTLEEKVGQLFWARVPSNHQIEDLQSYHLSGYILFGRDFEGRSIEDMKALTKDYQAAAKIPLLIGSDEEGGTVTRISSILETPFQSPMALYQQGGMEAVLSDTKQKAELLKSVGINAGLFPVADLSRNQSAFIYDRTIGQNAPTTASYVQQVVEELKKSKVGSTLKHFPGYGDNGDSHTAIIQDNRSLDELRQADFLPFQAGIDAGADSVLVSHNILSKIDTVPSSISPKITDLLRKELHFKGVIMTDDFDMAGIADFVSQDEAAFQVIVAGNDLILGSSYQTQIPYLLKKISSGEVTEERKKSKVGSTLKHFPGYGDNGDSHTAIIQDNRSLDELRQADFLPFQAGIDVGADSVLVSHNILSKIDTVPSSISPKITDLLRKELHFKGVIMTDDFDMAGLADFVSQEEAAFQVIVAGNDLILGSSYQTQIPYLLKKISSGELTEERIDESVRRILTWKYDLGLLGAAQ